MIFKIALLWLSALLLTVGCYSYRVNKRLKLQRHEQEKARKRKSKEAQKEGSKN